MVKRSVTPFINEYLQEKIVLLSGPRQVGKTYLSKNLSQAIQYFNFDSIESRREMMEKSWLRDGSLVVFDEVHKMRKWKQWLKGIYDTERQKNQILVTGSAMLETFKKAGDSLAGRHFSVRLMPFSLREIAPIKPKACIDQISKLGSFPEPFLGGNERKAALWRRSHLDVILRQDIVSQESFRDISSIETLVELLSHRVGQGISYQNLAAELSTSAQTVKRWIRLLESYYVIFSIHPYVKNVAEALKKEPRIFFYDVGRVRSDEGFKLENIVALHLLKRNFFLEDTQGVRARLCYLRDKKKREVDFAIEVNNQLTHLIEVKNSDDGFNPSLNYFSLRLKPKCAYQIVLNLKKEKEFENFKVVDLCDFLMNLET